MFSDDALTVVYPVLGAVITDWMETREQGIQIIGKLIKCNLSQSKKILIIMVVNFRE